MIKRQRFKSATEVGFQEAWDLYQKSFPDNERRQFSLQEKIISNPNYHFEVINKSNVFLGLLLWWQLETFRYIEHFATASEYRGKGYGQKIMEQFILESQDVIILEVDLPRNSISRRRIVFYERLGFKMNPHYYQQLPLQVGKPKLELKLMSFPQTMTKSDLLFFENKFKTECYIPYLGGN